MVSTAHMSAAMIGGVTFFLFLSLWFNLCSYVNALVAHNYGADKKERCALALSQGLYLPLIIFPLILACIPLGLMIFKISGHAPEQLILEKRYFTILLAGSLAPLFRASLTGFFVGIGRTRLVMIADLIGMAANIPLTYGLIFGRFGLPALGIDGAAYATILSTVITVVILLIDYFQPNYRREFNIMSNLHFDYRMFRQLIRYGLPAGFEIMLKMVAFTLIITLFHSYSLETAAATTITFNWDFVAFFPMLGISMATTSLVGQNIGANDIYEAKRATFSGLKIACFYAVIMGITFFTIPDFLTRIFLPDKLDASAREIFILSKTMLRMISIYVVFNASEVVFSGALRGAGDTRWVMMSTLVLSWVFATAEFILIRYVGIQLITAWAVLVMMPITAFFVFFLRFQSGKWQSYRIAEL